MLQANPAAQKRAAKAKHRGVVGHRLANVGSWHFSDLPKRPDDVGSSG
jgi:hypothetical protein